MNMSDAEKTIRRTPLYNIHVDAGARIVPFSGWDMPVQYEGILAEHDAVRKAAGLFDVSHMGRLEIRGPDAVEFVNHITVNDVNRLAPFTSQYTLACYDHGGIVDDFLVYRCPDRILLIPNAGNRAKDLAWIRQHADGYNVEILDLSDVSILVALQGPKSEAILNPLTDTSLDELAFQHFVETRINGIWARVFRTGYTGEDGFEIWAPAEHAVEIWQLLITSGAGHGLKPCGLGARDTLRLEAGLALYGHEIDEHTNPLEAGLGWVTRLKKQEFIGKDRLLQIRRNGIERKLIGFKLLARGIPRAGYGIYHQGKPIGTAVSGTMAPSLGYGIGTGYVPNALTEPGTQLNIEIRNKFLPAEVVKLPFYKGSRKV
jgi:aminomethyltransferase